MGEGEFGIVYHVRRKSDKAHFALKRISKEDLVREPGSQNRIMRLLVEIAVTTALPRHSNIGYTEEVLHNDDFVFIITGLVMGRYDCTHAEELRCRLYHYYVRHNWQELHNVEALAQRWEAHCLKLTYRKLAGDDATIPKDLLPEVQRLDPNLCTYHRELERYVASHLTLPEPPIEGTLHSYMLENDHCLSDQVSSSIMRQLLEALVHLHAHYIIHRDIKNENILISEHRSMQRKLLADGSLQITLRTRVHVTLIDFGFAKVLNAPSMSEFGYVDPPAAPFVMGMMRVLEDMSPKVTPPESPIQMSPCGSSGFMAAEVVDSILSMWFWEDKWKSHKATLPKLDMWAAGVVGFCAYCGHYPFAIGSLKSQQDSIREGPVFPDFVHPDAAHFIGSLLDIDPSRRPSAIEALIALGTSSARHLTCEIVISPGGGVSVDWPGSIERRAPPTPCMLSEDLIEIQRTIEDV
jgi:serine/threonine protein kinase